MSKWTGSFPSFRNRIKKTTSSQFASESFKRDTLHQPWAIWPGRLRDEESLTSRAHSMGSDGGIDMDSPDRQATNHSEFVRFRGLHWNWSGAQWVYWAPIAVHVAPRGQPARALARAPAKERGVVVAGWRKNLSSSDSNCITEDLEIGGYSFLGLSDRFSMWLKFVAMELSFNGKII